MPILDNETLLALWLEGALDDSQHALFMQRCADDPEFAAVVEQANMFTENTDAFAQWPLPQWKETEWKVPQWERNTPINTDLSWMARLSKWMSSGHSQYGVISVGLSCCALVIAVLTFTNQLGTQRAYELSNPATMTQMLTEQDIDQLVQQKVEQKITEQQQLSQAMFAQYADALQTQQLATSKQLTEYLLSSSRQERKEDFAQLVQFINEQRVNDQRFYAQQFNDLQDEIYAINPSPINISQE
ncbi:MAG: hypothetical protein P8J70_07175 [Glaciecola sp.]|jgi:hypothetical protein|nr:hypothetical protein [Glaciecola sp.]MDG1814571.1 hypothetical protein [Glaciecola sp.]MDG2099445.1 hypothetical protein [Glaciecola sp.]